MYEKTQRLIIVEGPDGAGKTTVARKIAKFVGAEYVHFPALPKVGPTLARAYIEGMLPALLGFRPVVFDRSWLSEEPYGIAFRNGYQRIDTFDKRILERLAMRCGAMVIKCFPPTEVVLQNYRRRRNVEMLENETQLERVYKLYRSQITHLDEIEYDYTLEQDDVLLHHLFETSAYETGRHLLNVKSSGNWDADNVMVGSFNDEPGDTDSLHQWPAVGFELDSVQKWLTKVLSASGVPENKVLWLDSDQDLSVVAHLFSGRNIIASDVGTYKILYQEKIQARGIPSPKAWMRDHQGWRRSESMLAEFPQFIEALEL